MNEAKRMGYPEARGSRMATRTGPLTPTHQRALAVQMRQMASRVLERARRPMAVEVAFVRLRRPEHDRRSVDLEPPESSLAVHEFESLYFDSARRRPESLRAAIQKRLEDRDREQGWRSFAGLPAWDFDSDVVPIIRFEARAFDSQPALCTTDLEDGRWRCRSLLEGIARTLLLEATRRLRTTTEGDGTYERLSRDPEDVLRTAGRRLMVTVGRVGGHPQGLIGLFDEINEIASLRYEGRDPTGSIVVARVDHPAITRELVLKHPVPLEEAVWARKVLELSTRTSRLLTDSLRIHALGGVSADYDATREDLFVVDFEGHQRWELRHGQTTLMHVVYGVPALPEEPLDDVVFRRALLSAFGGLPETSLDRIWAVVRRALGQTHGALVVIADNAEAEGMRLANQGVAMEPAYLRDETVEQVTSIDGAVLLDTTGRCHAVGVILDGRARSEVGSPARGARYNSAVRYVDATAGSALAVVVSEDGRVDLVRGSVCSPEKRAR